MFARCPTETPSFLRLTNPVSSTATLTWEPIAQQPTTMLLHRLRAANALSHCLRHHAAPTTNFPLPCGPLLCRNLIVQSSPQDHLVKLDDLAGSDSGIVELKLERAKSKNAISKDMLRGLESALEAIRKDSSANVVLVSSSVPGVFCVGADLKERVLMSISEVRQFVNSLRWAFSSLENLSVPTIAVVEGVALGGGTELALSCDLRICGEDATFGLPETGLAIIPGAGGTQRLPRIVGKSVAKELIFTGRRIDGRHASRIGLVNHCVPSGEARVKALQVAREINSKGPLALKMAKRAINRGLDVEMSAGLEIEGRCYEELLNTKDRLEGLAAFAEKRLPTYKGE